MAGVGMVVPIADSAGVVLEDTVEGIVQTEIKLSFVFVVGDRDKTCGVGAEGVCMSVQSTRFSRPYAMWRGPTARV